MARLACNIGDLQERRPFEQHHLFSSRSLGQLAQVVLYEVQIRRQALYDIFPCGIERLIPYARPIGPHHPSEVSGVLFYEIGLCVQELISSVVGDKVHFVDQAEHVSLRGILVQGMYYLRIGFKINGRFRRVEVSGFGVKDVDEDSDVTEDLALLAREILFREGVLTEGYSVSQ